MEGGAGEEGAEGEVAGAAAAVAFPGRLVVAVAIRVPQEGGIPVPPVVVPGLQVAGIHDLPVVGASRGPLGAVCRGPRSGPREALRRGLHNGPQAAVPPGLRNGPQGAVRRVRRNVPPPAPRGPVVEKFLRRPRSVRRVLIAARSAAVPRSVRLTVAPVQVAPGLRSFRAGLTHARERERDKNRGVRAEHSAHRSFPPDPAQERESPIAQGRNLARDQAKAILEISWVLPGALRWEGRSAAPLRSGRRSSPRIDPESGNAPG